MTPTRRRARIAATLLVAVVATAAAVGVGTATSPLAPGLMQVQATSPAVPVTSLAVKGRPGPRSRTLTTNLALTEKPQEVAVSDTGSAADQQKKQKPDAAASATLPRLPAYRLMKPAAALEKRPEPPPGPVPGDPFSFGIGTLNILGSQHRGGGTNRAAALAGAIQGRGVDLVGMQEVQRDQLGVLQARLGGYSIWPGQALGNQGVRLQIAWRDALFELRDTGSIITTFDNQQRPIPYVLLRHRETQGEFYVIDIHNSPRDQEAARDSATGQQIALIRQLQATGKTVFILGDTNEKTEFFCRVAASTGMVASNGGTTAGGGCNVGAGPIKIDWILGSGQIDFFGHVVDYNPPIRTATDHAFVHADVTVTPLITPDEP
ncbi:hypothetical protein GCM10027020_15120 [Nocardioides salsibiostraticola]